MGVELFILGDSIALGCWDKEEGGYAIRLYKYLNKKYDVILYNLSISGADSEDILEVAKNEISKRMHKDYDKIFILHFGINDSSILLKTNKNQVSLKEFERNYLEIIKILKNYGKIICLGLTKVDERINPWLNYKLYLNSEIKKYNEKIKEICEKENIIFVNLFDDFNAELLHDGLHPNSKGHKLIFEKLKNMIL